MKERKAVKLWQKRLIFLAGFVVVAVVLLVISYR
jgi:hypothetical protein